DAAQDAAERLVAVEAALGTRVLMREIHARRDARNRRAPRQDLVQRAELARSSGQLGPYVDLEPLGPDHVGDPFESEPHAPVRLRNRQTLIEAGVKAEASRPAQGSEPRGV